MENNKPLAFTQDIEDIAFDLLKQSKSLGIFPTPVDEIIKFSELLYKESRYLDQIQKNYKTNSPNLLKEALKKLNGLLDRKEKTIYVNPYQLESRKKFIKLHEVGHNALPWQKDTYELFADDEISISTLALDEFELEASYFASATLFQLDSFDQELLKLPLEIGSAIALSKKFGASIHATLRRYVECSTKKCALLVLKNPCFINMTCDIRNYFESQSFTREFGEIKWEESLTLEWSFVEDYFANKTLHKDGEFSLQIDGSGRQIFNYHYFNNTYNAFVFIMPKGERQNSRTKIFIGGK